ncbi:MAG: hypothetical protein WC337_09750 [Candidatus Muiribacteriota bacterium]
MFNNFIKAVGEYIFSPYKNAEYAEDDIISQVDAEYPFVLNIDIKKKNIDEYRVYFSIFDKVDNKFVGKQEFDIKRGEIKETITQDVLVMFTEAKISERGERLIYSTSIHFDESTLYHERMTVKLYSNKIEDLQAA